MKKFLSLFFISLCVASASYAAVPVATAPAQQYIFNLEYTDAEQAVGAALAKKGLGGIINATANGHSTAPLYSYNKPIEVEIRGLQADENSKRWSANMLVLSDGAVITAMPLAGRYSLMVEMPVLKHTIRMGELIKEEDIEIKNFAAERNSSDYVSDMSALIGKTPIRSISPARPVRTHEVAEPAIVKKNAMVQMRYKIGGLEITATGQSMDNGAKGDAIMVKNLASKKLVRAVVANEGTVDVLTGSEVQPAQQVSQLTGVGQYAK